ncbi:NADPH-dependent FMN reductase [Rhodococcus aetherivorans]
MTEHPGTEHSGTEHPGTERTYRVGYFVGSLSSTSINRILAKALIRLAPHDLEFVEIAIRDLPLYSPDYDANYPPEGPRSRTRSPLWMRCCSSHPSTTGRFPGR